MSTTETTAIIVALVTGIFSLFIAIKNNRRLLELEKSKQKFTVDQGRYKELRDAYEELLRLLPEEKLLGHFITNLPLKEDFQENGLLESVEVAEENIKILHSHFQKYYYLFSEDEQKTVANLFDEIDNIAKNIININLGMQIYNTEEKEDSIDSSSVIQEKIEERIIKVVEFEEMYYNLFKSNLSKMSNLNSND